MTFKLEDLLPYGRRFQSLVHNQSKVNPEAQGEPDELGKLEAFSSVGIVLGRTRAGNAQQRVGLRGNQGKPEVEVFGLACEARLVPD